MPTMTRIENPNFRDAQCAFIEHDVRRYSEQQTSSLHVICDAFCHQTVTDTQDAIMSAELLFKYPSNQRIITETFTSACVLFVRQHSTFLRTLSLIKRILLNHAARHDTQQRPHRSLEYLHATDRGFNSGSDEKQPPI